MTISFELTRKIYSVVMIITWISYITALSGVILFNPTYINMLDNVTKTLVALFLIIRFNPFNNIIMTKFDKQIAWNAGIFLLLTSTLTVTIKSYFISGLSNIIF